MDTYPQPRNMRTFFYHLGRSGDFDYRFRFDQFRAGCMDLSTDRAGNSLCHHCFVWHLTAPAVNAGGGFAGRPLESALVDDSGRYRQRTGDTGSRVSGTN